MKMLKTNTLLLILLFFLFTSFNPEVELYHVVKVIGTIYSEAKDKNIDTGDEIARNESFIFKTEDSKATVINPEKGRFTIQASEDSNSKTDFIPPMSHQTRAFGDITNLKKYFIDNFAVIEECEIPISKTSYIQNEDNYFVIKYTLNEETIERKLSYNDNMLKFSKEEIFMQDCTLVEFPEDNLVSLYYYKNGVYKHQVDFSLYFLNEEQLKKEVSIILEAIKNETEVKKKKEVSDYIYDFYAKPDQINVEKWIEENF